MGQDHIAKHSGFDRGASQERQPPGLRLKKLLRQLKRQLSLVDIALLLPPRADHDHACLVTTTGSDVRIPWSQASSASLLTSAPQLTILPLDNHSVPGWLLVRSAADVPLRAEDQRRLTTALPQLSGIAESLFADRSPDLPEELLALVAMVSPPMPTEAARDQQIQELLTLLWVTRGMQHALRLNELIHFLLSAATAEEGGGFERAMLFIINERSETLQGMLGVTSETSQIVLPREHGFKAWDQPHVTPVAQHAQRCSDFSTNVMKQRVSMHAESNPLALCALQRRLVYIADPAQDEPTRNFAEGLGLGPFICAPLLGRQKLIGVLVVDSPLEQQGFSPDRLRFLELFSRHAGVAMENAMLLRRLEATNDELRETRDRLLQGEKMAVLGEVVATLAHEIKTPLVSIGGFAKRLKDLTDGDPARHYAEIICRETRRLEDLLGGVLSLSRKQMVCYAPCEPAALLREVLQLDADTLGQAAITLSTEIDPDLPQIQGDCARLKQVLINLMTNAREAMPQGGDLQVRAHAALLRGAPAVAIEIEDSGRGIPKEIFGSIFDSFFTTKNAGTGLGLSISARIIEQHHGDIKASNSPRGGAVFRLLLPALQAPPGDQTRNK